MESVPESSFTSPLRSLPLQQVPLVDTTSPTVLREGLHPSPSHLGGGETFLRTPGLTTTLQAKTLAQVWLAWAKHALQPALQQAAEDAKG